MRVIDWVHRNASNRWPDTSPSLSTCFTEATQTVFAITDLTDRGSTLNRNLPYLARAKSQLSVGALFGKQLNRGPSRTRHLSTFSWLQLNTMYGRTDWNVLDWDAVARLNRSQ
jgi:hypothetical protein